MSTSPVHWDLKVTFKSREQATSFIQKILVLEIFVPFEIEDELGQFGDHTYSVYIEDMSWANNLTTIARLLEEVDCNPNL